MEEEEVLRVSSLDTSSCCLLGYRWAYVRMTTGTVSPIRLATRTIEYPSSIKENGNIIRTGANAGKLLVDELMHDLMEVEKRVG